MSENPNEIYKKGGKEDVPGLMRSGGARTESGQGQVDAAALVEAEAKVDGGGRARRFGLREEEDDAKRHAGKNGKDP